ncbi:hypothetical protein COCNU_scaffold006534G000020 [Cocos nucifera]|nr:hypothetical protein [Cocos nucifera]
MVIKSTSSISVYDCSSFTEIRSFEIPFPAAILSPCGTYLQTFRKSITLEEKRFALSSIQVSFDESVAFGMATNEIQFYDAKDFSKGIAFRLKHLVWFPVELLKSPGSHIAACVAESEESYLGPWRCWCEISASGEETGVNGRDGSPEDETRKKSPSTLKSESYSTK